MAHTKQVREGKRALMCSFCGGEGHNIRGCVFAGEARCFFAPEECVKEKCSPSSRKCSGCGEVGHYKKKCPNITQLTEKTEVAHKRPRGRSPKGMVWNSETGVWEKGTSPLPTKEKFKRPRGRSPKGMVWNPEIGFWETEIQSPKSPVRRPRHHHRPRSPSSQSNPVRVSSPAAAADYTPPPAPPLVWNPEIGFWETEIQSPKSPVRKARTLMKTHSITSQNKPVEVIKNPLDIGCNGYITPGVAHCISAAVDPKWMEELNRQAPRITASELEAAYAEVWPNW